MISNHDSDEASPRPSDDVPLQPEAAQAGQEADAAGADAAGADDANRSGESQQDESAGDASGSEGPVSRPDASSPDASSPDASSPVKSSPVKSSPRRVPIVAVGSSAGGLEALQLMFENVSTSPGVAFVVISHQHPNHVSVLPQILMRTTSLPAVEASDGLVIEADRIYVAPSHGHLEVSGGVLRIREAPREGASGLPIDHFFSSLAEDRGSRAVGVILSGTGHDGSAGAQRIKERGGQVIVQDPASARYAGMPSNALDAVSADDVLSPEQIAARLLRVAQHDAEEPRDAAAPPHAFNPHSLNTVFRLLRRRTGHDFSFYKENTVRRRIERRMQVHDFHQLEHYLQFLQRNPQELDLLFQELLISVTSFFRDPSAWEALRKPLATLIQHVREQKQNLRVWVPGCATGEEVYSLAILIRETIADQAPLDVQIFGTDLDTQAIEIARQGRFSETIAEQVSPERLNRFFIHDEGTYRIRQEIRESVVFALHNLIKDPPFSRIDLISCRNLLIYLRSELQTRLLPLFHYALRPQGLLLLGPSESTGAFTDLFEPVDRHWKIFRRREVAQIVSQLPEVPTSIRKDEPTSSESSDDDRPRHSEALGKDLQQILLARFAPPSVVINERGDILLSHGRTGKYLELPQGKPRNNVLEMARGGLKLELDLAFRHCLAEGRDVVREHPLDEDNPEAGRFTLHVTMLEKPERIRGLLLVSFQEKRELAVAPPDASDHAEGQQEAAPEETRPPASRSGRVNQLERELRQMEDRYRTTYEELETTNEEFKATTEELQSTNEELQSTNEELETSKEEMQSLNEELTTVNAELQARVDDLSAANDEMQDLMDSTGIATVFLDAELKIERFTNQACQLIRLRQSDIGRPLSELSGELQDVDLSEKCRQVLITLEIDEQEVCDREGTWYLMRIAPYRTSENEIEGVVLTFVGIQRLKQAEALSRSRAFFENVVGTIRQPLLVLDNQLAVVLANRCFGDTFRIDPKQLVGQPLERLGDGAWDIPDLKMLLRETLSLDRSFDDFEIAKEFPRVGYRRFQLNGRRIEQAAGMPDGILLAFEDVTDQAAS